jgi:hypothetical protein
VVVPDERLKRHWFLDSPSAPRFFEQARELGSERAPSGVMTVPETSS